MNPFQFINPILSTPASGVTSEATPASIPWIKKLWGGVLVIVGYLLSPLCWWNDVVFNLPLALGFGYLFSRAYPDALIPLTVVGYWLSNVLGFMLMQQGALTALQENQPSTGSSLRNGLLTSTAYTLVIVALLQLHIITTPDIFRGDIGTTLAAMLPEWLPF